VKIEMQNTNTAIAFISGIFGGTGASILIQIQSHPWLHFSVTLITAFLCGVAGLLGKDLYLLIKHSLKKRKA
jgi:hypothetical protein